MPDMPVESARGPQERRTEERIPLEIALEFEGGRGSTRNVSEGGVLFETKQTGLGVGDRLRLWLVLTHVDPAGPLYVEAIGQVVRVERADEGSAVAVRFDGYHLSTQRGPDPTA